MESLETPKDGIRLEGWVGHIWGPLDSENQRFQSYRIPKFLSYFAGAAVGVSNIFGLILWAPALHPHRLQNFLLSRNTTLERSPCWWDYLEPPLIADGSSFHNLSSIALVWEPSWAPQEHI